jgi:hypothetical protein
VEVVDMRNEVNAGEQQLSCAMVTRGVLTFQEDQQAGVEPGFRYRGAGSSNVYRKLSNIDVSLKIIILMLA